MRIELGVSAGVEPPRPGLAVKVAVELALLSSFKRADRCDGGGSDSFKKRITKRRKKINKFAEYTIQTFFMRRE